MKEKCPKFHVSSGHPVGLAVWKINIKGIMDIKGIAYMATMSYMQIMSIIPYMPNMFNAPITLSGRKESCNEKLFA